MTHYNRANPFLYILEQSNDELIFESKNLLKRDIILHVLTAVWIITAGVKCIVGVDFTSNELIVLVVCILINRFGFTRVKNAIMYTKTSYIDRKKYPDESITTYVTLNNEELFKDALTIKSAIGEVKGYIKTINTLSLMILLCILVYAVNIIIMLI